MFYSGLLVLSTSTALRRASPLSIIQSCSQYVKKVLYVHLVNDDVDFSDHCSLPNVSLVQSICKYITDFYTNASHAPSPIDVRFLLSNISSHSHLGIKPHQLRHGYDVILTDFESEKYSKLQSYVAYAFPNITSGVKTLHGFDKLTSRSESAEKYTDEKINSYDFVVLGGTFDRLHVGHKILLSEGCIICDKALTVGVTDGEMNKNKILPELMEPLSVRIDAIMDFLLDIKPSIEHRVVPINDIYGPTITDPSLQCLVVSQETIRGGESVNSKRKTKEMSELKVDVIQLVPNLFHAAEEEEKVSSSTSRIRLLGTLLKDPKKVYNKRPFVIGLTGGTASGKSSIGKRLEKLGAGIVDCDALGHRSYEPGTVTIQKVIDEFGADVVDSKGYVDRKVLGSKVFGNKEMMSRLNSIVWPAIAQLAAEEVKVLADRGVEVIVLDAAILLEAGWDSMVDEVWVAVIPPKEAIKRLVDRNNLTEEQAQKRIDSQLTNMERVAKADVVLCTFWEPEVTQKQVEKAWKLLHKRLSCGNSAL